MIKLLVLATANIHKVAELNALLANVDVRVISAAEAGFREEIEETGATLEDNALLKARRVAAETHLPTLADDTGLEVDALGGAPGVRSARFAGERCIAEDNRRLLLEKLKGVELSLRTAQFRCVLAFVDGDAERLFEGACHGCIATEERGVHGFGYDALFVPDGQQHTMAELSADEKNALSHRGRAVKAFSKFLAESRGS